MTPRFDLVDLILFSNIAETRSVTLGARRSNMSSPAASIRLKKLEDALGVRLLDRTGKGVNLTSSGTAFLSHAQRILEQLETLGGDIREYSQGVKGQVRLTATVTPSSTELLPRIIQDYRLKHPQVHVSFKERLSAEVIRAVREGAADIGIVLGPVPTPNLEVVPYFKDRLVLIVPLDHPLAAKKRVSFSDVLQFDIIGFLEVSAVHRFMRQNADRMNKPLNFRIQVDTVEALCRMVEAGLGVAVTPGLVARHHAKSMAIKFIELSDASAARELWICVRKLSTLPACARDFIDQLLEGAGNSARRRS